MNQIKKFTQKDRYGNTTTYEFEAPVKPVDQTALMKAAMEQMQSGMQVPQMEMSMGIPEMHPGEPKGSDTVPAWLTPGEFVMNAEAVREFGPEIEAMNNHGRAVQRAQGGTIPGHYDDGGLIPSPGVSNPETPLYAQDGQFVPEATRIQSPLEWIGGKFGIGPQEDELIPALEATPEEAITDWMTEGADINQQQRLRDLTPQGQVLVRNPEADAAAGEDAYVSQDVPTLDSQTEIDVQETVEDEEAGVPPAAEAPPTVAQQKVANNDITDEDIDNIMNVVSSDSPADPDKDKDTLDLINELGKSEAEKDPSLLDKIWGGLKKAAGNLYDNDQLMTSALMYLGSRAMGYDHAGSIRFAGNNYLQGIDAKKKAKQAAVAENDKRTFELAKTGKYTPQSVRAFEASGGNEALLVPVDDKKGGNTTINRTETVTIAVDGKPMKVHPAKDADGNEFYVTGNGKVVDTLNKAVETDLYKIKGTKEWNNRISQYRGDTTKQLRSLQEQFGTFGEGQDKQTITDLNPETAAGEVAQWAAQNDIAPEELGALVESAYADMRAQSGGKNRKSDIRPFLNQLVVRNSTGAAASLFQTGVNEDTGQPTYIDSSKLKNVNNAISTVLKSQGQANRKATDIANLYYNKKLPGWNELGPEGQKKWENLANEGENGFYVYIANQLGIDNRAPK